MHALYVQSMTFFRSVEVLLSQVSANTQDLDHLQEKVGEKLLKKPTEIMEEILKQKDAKIKGREMHVVTHLHVRHKCRC